MKIDAPPKFLTELKRKLRRATDSINAAVVRLDSFKKAKPETDLDYNGQLLYNKQLLEHDCIVELPLKLGKFLAEYNTHETKKWFREDELNATLVITYATKTINAYSISLPITKPEKTKLLISLLKDIVSLDLSQDETYKVLRQLEMRFNLGGLCNSYYKQEYHQLACDSANSLKKVLDASKREVELALAEVEEIVKVDPTQLAAQYLKEQKAKIDQKLAQLEAEVKAKLKQKEKESKEALKIKQQLLDEKISELDSKLAAHREEIAKDFFKVAPRLAEIFPDVTHYQRYNRRSEHSNYDRNVDGYLRTFYVLKLQEVLNQNQWLTVDFCLNTIELIRNTCFAKNRRPEGSELRESFSGFLAVATFLSEKNVPLQDVTQLLLTEAKNCKGKPGVEEYVEAALHVDFDMSKFMKQLHKTNAKTKKDLGLK